MGVLTMATKRVCDRCGAEINPYNSVTYAGMRRIKSDINDNDYELCVSCAHELRKWFNGEENDVVHGRWEWFNEETGTPSTGYEIEYGWRCSHCKEELPDDYDDPDDSPTFRFCYNCGAKMDGGDNDANKGVD